MFKKNSVSFKVSDFLSLLFGHFCREQVSLTGRQRGINIHEREILSSKYKIISAFEVFIYFSEGRHKNTGLNLTQMFQMIHSEVFFVDGNFTQCLLLPT